MRALRITAAVLALAIATPACAPLQDAGIWINHQFTTGSAPQANSVAAAEAFYTAADKSITGAIQQGVLSAATVQKIKDLDNKVYGELVPLRQAAEAGDSVALPALLAAYNAAFGNLYNAAQDSGVPITVPTQIGGTS